MKRENLQLLITLVKIKKLKISELEKVFESKKYSQEDRVNESMIQNEKTEVKILSGIIKSEEKE